MARALLGSGPINTSWPNTHYATIGKAVFSPCSSEPGEVDDRAVPSSTEPRSFPRQLRCKHGTDATVLFMNPLLDSMT
jgi:hypothetical protein